MHYHDLNVDEAKEFLGFILSRCKRPVRLWSPTYKSAHSNHYRARAQVKALQWRKKYPNLFAAWAAKRRLEGKSTGWL